MKDIKINKVNKVNKIQNTETRNVVSPSVSIASIEKPESFVFGKVLLSSLCVSIFTYLFFVTSTVYLAVNTQKFAYNIESIKTEISVDGSDVNTDTSINKKDRISFINKNSDTAISLK